MLTLKRNIVFSILFHALVAVSVVIAGWNIIGDKKNFIVVSFVEEALYSETSGDRVIPARGKDQHRQKMRKAEISGSKKAVDSYPLFDKDIHKTDMRPLGNMNQVEHAEDMERPVFAEQSSEATTKKRIQDSEQTALSARPVITPWYGGHSQEKSDSRGLTKKGIEDVGSGHAGSLLSSSVEHGGSGDTDYLRAIQKAIEKAKQYPFLAKKRGIQGAVTTAFTIDQAGNPEQIRIIRSSGSRILDSAAKKTILAAAPFPHVRGDIEIRISYILKE
ncbi:MAG: energy transducer TonB [Nitrospiraceae bacterium]|nr:MAG: energy transducer TonB [Nitrospiraceae bacterium]